jgi:hypothetical protein
MYARRPVRETVIPMTKIAASLFALILSACSSPTPATSSSSHWVACTTMDDCSSVAGAVACTDGYCVDSSGQKIEPKCRDAKCSLFCNPLDPTQLPVTLGTVLGVGRDPQGTTYMADDVSGNYRVFVSEGNDLVRRRAVGSGSSGGGADADYTITFEDGASSRTLMIQKRSGAVTAMAVGPRDDKKFIPDGGPTSGALTVLDNGSISAFPLVNLPGDVTIEYVALVVDGDLGDAGLANDDYIVVTRPTDDWQYTDFRVFYGLRSQMLEREVTSVVRSRGGGTDIRFKVDGVEFFVTFTWVLEPAADGGTNSHPGPAIIETDKGSLPVEQRYPTPTTLPEFTFSCL